MGKSETIVQRCIIRKGSGVTNYNYIMRSSKRTVNVTFEIGIGLPGLLEGLPGTEVKMYIYVDYIYVRCNKK